MRNVLTAILLSFAIAGGAYAQGISGGPPPGGTDMPPGRPGRPGGRLFISPMGEPFRGDDGEAAWFKGADTDHDGFLSRKEMIADALRFHASLDTNKDGEIDPEEMTRYETDIAPETGAGGFGGGPGGHPGGMRGGRRGGGSSGGGGPGGGMGPPGGGRPEGGDALRSSASTRVMRQGAGRFSFLDIPQPVIAADGDFNRGVSRQEFSKAASERFSYLDADHDGRISFSELPELPRQRRP